MSFRIESSSNIVFNNISPNESLDDLRQLSARGLAAYALRAALRLRAFLPVSPSGVVDAVKRVIFATEQFIIGENNPEFVDDSDSARWSCQDAAQGFAATLATNAVFKSHITARLGLNGNEAALHFAHMASGAAASAVGSFHDQTAFRDFLSAGSRDFSAILAASPGPFPKTGDGIPLETLQSLWPNKEPDWQTLQSARDLAEERRRNEPITKSMAAKMLLRDEASKWFSLFSDDVDGAELSFKLFQEARNAYSNNSIGLLKHHACNFICAVRRIHRLLDKMQALPSFPRPIHDVIKEQFRRKEAFLEAFKQPRNAIEHIDDEASNHTKVSFFNLIEDSFIVSAEGPIETGYNSLSVPGGTVVKIDEKALKKLLSCRDAIVDAILHECIPLTGLGRYLESRLNKPLI